MYFVTYWVLCVLDSFNIHILSDKAETKVQKIFTTVINNGYYSADGYIHMCRALTAAKYSGKITQYECDFAKKEIKRYIKEYILLSGKLKSLNHPSTFDECLKIYDNWIHRPFYKIGGL